MKTKAQQNLAFGNYRRMADLALAEENPILGV